MINPEGNAGLLMPGSPSSKNEKGPSKTKCLRATGDSTMPAGRLAKGRRDRECGVVERAVSGAHSQ